MTTVPDYVIITNRNVVEACRLDRYDNCHCYTNECFHNIVVEACRLDRYDNPCISSTLLTSHLVVEACRLDRYDNFVIRKKGMKRPCERFMPQKVSQYRLPSAHTLRNGINPDNHEVDCPS